MSERQRDALADAIRARARAWAVVHVEPDEIDTLNILQATMAGMVRAVAGLGCVPDRVLIDGNRVPAGLGIPAQAIVGGDGSEPCISAASILAKTARDARMCAADADFPAYGFAGHKGYPTPAHLAALQRHGATPLHRRSFAPVKAVLGLGQQPLVF